MKLNNSFFYTIRQDMSDEDSLSSNLLVRSGMIKKGKHRNIYVHAAWS